MKRIQISFLIAFLFIAIIFAGCQKEIQTSSAKETTADELAVANNATQNRSENGCRLILKQSKFGNESYTYNENGLVDKWSIEADGGFFKEEYNSSGRLIKSRFYSGDVLLNTIVFYYQGDKVVHEIWYNGDTQEKGDEVFYTFDSKGEIIKMQSFIQDYVTNYKYTPEGNVYEWDFNYGGQPFYTVQYTFLNHDKNPDLARPGINYDFPYVNGAVSQNKWWSTSEKDIIYDDQGNPVVALDQDPHQTVVGVGHENYVTTSNYFDVISQSWSHFVFNYGNCGPDDNNAIVSMPKSSSTTTNNNRFNFSKLLIHGSAKSIKEQIKELRKQIQNNQSL